MIAAAIVVAVAVIVLVWAIRTTNDFKRQEIRIEESASGIEVALTKRYDMLTKMLDAARSYAKYEQETLFRSISLREGMSMDDMSRASRTMDGMAREINLRAEQYPELRSSEAFIQLQSGIRDAEEHLQAARRLYNSSVREFNTSIRMFPDSLLAGRLEAREFFEAGDDRKEDVDMTIKEVDRDDG